MNGPPHHGVVRQDKETTKLRVVFRDGSAKPDNSSVSINDCLGKGPNLVPYMFDVIINFRGYPIGMVADIGKAFHQVTIAPEDRRMVRFLWFDNPSKERPEIQKYQFCRLVFGLVSSPAILTSVLQHHLGVNEEKEPKMVPLLRKSFCVYDFAGGVFDDNEAGEVYGKSQTLMSSGGFTLRKWHTNSKHLQKKIATDRAENQHEANDKANNTHGSDQECKTRNDQVKVLGIPWNVDENTLFHDYVKWSKEATTLPATKRSVLQLSAKMFDIDPIGLFTPLN